MPATERGVYHNLKESKYTISNSEIVFYFSSKFVMNKFLSGYEQHRQQYLERLMKLDKEIPLNMETLADIKFYRNCEKRGFRARLLDSDISRKDLYRYALRKMSEESTFDWFIVENPRWNRFKGVH